MLWNDYRRLMSLLPGLLLIHGGSCDVGDSGFLCTCLKRIHKSR